MRTGRSDIGLEASLEGAPAGAAAGGAPLTTALRADPSLAAWIARQVADQAGRLALWTPVAFGCGAAVYFALPREPLTVVALALLAAAAGLWVAARAWSGNALLTAAVVLAAFALGGFATAKLRVERVAAPIVAAAAAPAAVEAWVVDVANPGQRSGRVLLAPVRVQGLAPQDTPLRIRLTLRPDEPLPAPGAAVRMRAILNPPPPPATPGGYDFARDSFFDGIGAVGFALTPAEAVELAPPPWRLRLAMDVNAARWRLTNRIVQIMGVETGGLAAAMVTGHRAFVPREQVDAMRAAGLAHVIAISGLHMAIVGGFAFAAARLAIAAWPWAALRIPGKKAAALAGLAAVGLYLVVSGAPAPAQRAAITAAVAFGAMLADRRAISLHALAVAALIVLLRQPEAVTEPGFQMSFAATAALVVLAETLPRPAREIEAPWPIRAVQTAGVWLGGSLAVSLVAGLATGPFAMQHFNRVASFGLIANLLVAPIASFVMMPALAVGAVLAPLGLGEAPLAVCGLAIGLMVKIAGAAAAAPHATLLVASAPGWALPAAFLGILWICLWRGRLRWLGAPFALAVALAPRGPSPDVWIAADGSAAAVRREEGAVLLRPQARRFAAEMWAQRRGLQLPRDELAARDGPYDCDRWSCRARAGGSAPAVSGIWRLRAPTPEEMTQLCAHAEVVVVRAQAAPAACRSALVLDADDFARGGSAELYRTASGWRIVWAQDLRGRRPWSWGPSGSGG